MDLSLRTPIPTVKKAKSVPVFDSSAISSTEKSAANMPTTAPVMAVMTYGVRKRGWTLPSVRGNNPSRHIE